MSTHNPPPAPPARTGLAETKENMARCREVFAALLREGYAQTPASDTLIGAAECGAYLLTALEAMERERASSTAAHAEPHPRWKPNNGSDRHPQTAGEWDYRNDPTGEAAERSERRLNVAADYADPRAPDQMALVLRIDLSRIKSELIHKRAFFEMHRTKAVEEIPPEALADVSKRGSPNSLGKDES